MCPIVFHVLLVCQVSGKSSYDTSLVLLVSFAEKCNQTVVEKGRCLLIDANFPKVFWTEACSTAVYLLNRSPVKSLQNRTSHEVWSGQKLGSSQDFRLQSSHTYPEGTPP